MYRDVQWLDPDKYRLRDRKKPLSQIHECTVLQDALRDYYYHYEHLTGGDEFVAKFRVPHGTNAEEFVKNYFKGAVKGVDMDRVQPKYGRNYDILICEERELAKLWSQAQAESRCACMMTLTVPGTKFRPE
jgi:hypothetical protein